MTLFSPSSDRQQNRTDSTNTRSSLMAHQDTDVLLRPAALWRRADVLQRECPVPRVAGIDAWYFDGHVRAPQRDGCITALGASLLYVGISPKQAPSDGGRPSRQTLRSRIRYHFRGNAAGSTLRLTLGCLLSSELGIALRRVGSGDRFTLPMVKIGYPPGWTATPSSLGCLVSDHGNLRSSSSRSCHYRSTSIRIDVTHSIRY